jgi:hypothetical protein
MVKTSKSKSKSNVGKSSLKKFMKSSQISPHFINNVLDRDLDYESNYNKSLESHASHPSHAVNTTLNVNQNIESGSESESGIGNDESYHSNNTLDSDYDSDNDSDNDEIQEDNDNDNDNDDVSYSSITKTKDLKIFKMKNLLAHKRKTLLNKEQEVKELGKQNSFLETVIRDYEKYNTTILEEKQKQKKALKILSQHIRDIYKNINNKDDLHLSRVKNDQTLLLDEIEKIRDEIAYVLNSRGVEYQSSDGDVDSDGDADIDDYDNDNDDNTHNIY